MTAQRCSVLSSERGEPMLGTAFTEAGVLLVEQPGPWGHAGLAASRFDPDVAAALQLRADDAGLRLLAIRRPGRTPEGSVRRWAVSVDGALSWSRFDEDADLLSVALDGSAGERDASPTYLVCAHGKRDACCALRGRPVVAALEGLAPGRVWECSHTGGHRFAPIVLALPVGALYGRVPEPVLPHLVTATQRGGVLPELLRGVIGAPPAEQAAVGLALQQLGLDRPGDVQVRAVRDLAPGRVAVRVTVPGGDYELTLSAERVLTPSPSCAKPEPKPELQLRLLDFAAV